MIGERTKMMDDKCKRLLDGGPWDLMASALLPAYSTPIANSPWHMDMGCSLTVLPRKAFPKVEGAKH